MGVREESMITIFWLAALTSLLITRTIPNKLVSISNPSKTWVANMCYIVRARKTKWHSVWIIDQQLSNPRLLQPVSFTVKAVCADLIMVLIMWIHAFNYCTSWQVPCNMQTFKLDCISVMKYRSQWKIWNSTSGFRNPCIIIININLVLI